MCGIVGLFLANRHVSRTDIDAMNSRIVHRGPDGDGVYVDGPVGLGMRRLSIIDLDGGWQPISNESGRIQLVYNGEIYNYRELRQELTAKGHRFATNSDTEVAVHAYEQWGGYDFAKRLRGMFAIAIWDMDARELWIVRDRIGIKPLYYVHNDQGLGFASEIKSLLATDLFPRELEPRALAEYLTYGTAGPERSFVRSIRQLPPGSVMRCKNVHETDVRPFWQFRFPAQTVQLEEEEAQEMLLNRLQEAVRSHLVADVPVGAFLSGGIDSSGLVGLMAAEYGSSFKTFSIGFDEEEYNELKFAELVAQKWGTDHHSEIVRPDAIEVVEKLVDHFDEPFSDPSAIPTWYVAEIAAREVKVVLSGDGGDELFAGYTRYHEASRHAFLDRIPRSVRSLGSRIGAWLPVTMPGINFLDYAAHDHRGRYIYQTDLFPRRLREQILRPEWHEASLGEENILAQRSRVLAESAAPDRMSEYMYYDVLRYLPLDILVKVDRITMAHSLEARPPLLDHEFVEFAATLPISLKYRNGTTGKYLFKKAIEPLLPAPLMNRGKAGFSVPLRHWFAGPLATMFSDLVLAKGLCTEYFDGKVIRSMFEENRIGRRDHGTKLWSILVFEWWLRKFCSKDKFANHQLAVRSQ